MVRNQKLILLINFFLSSQTLGFADDDSFSKFNFRLSMTLRQGSQSNEPISRENSSTEWAISIENCANIEKVVSQKFQMFAP